MSLYFNVKSKRLSYAFPYPISWYRTKKKGGCNAHVIENAYSIHFPSKGYDRPRNRSPVVGAGLSTLKHHNKMSSKGSSAKNTLLQKKAMMATKKATHASR